MPRKMQKRKNTLDQALVKGSFFHEKLTDEEGTTTGVEGYDLLKNGDKVPKVKSSTKIFSSLS